MSKDFCENFRHVPAISTPAYFWFITFEMNLGELLGQLHDMYERGARSVCLHPVPPDWRPATCLRSEMSPGYLTEEFFGIIEKIVEECARLGIHYYLYDEGGWPSGGACGRVLAAHPEWRRQWVTLTPAGEVKVVEEPDTPGRAMLPDVLRPGATGEFIALTHENYRKHIGPHLGTTVKIAFMDEPAIAVCGPNRLTWTPDFAREFRRRKGYDIEPFLPELLRAAAPGDAGELVERRIDYHEVRTRLFIERFMEPIRDWCRANGLLSGGHLDGEDSPEMSCRRAYGSVMKALRAMDVPGADLIWRQIWPGLREHSFPRFASSVAHQQGKTRSLAELFGAYGNGLSPETLRWIIDYVLVHGLNLLVYGSYPQRNAKNWIAGCRPHFGPDDPLWKYFDEFHAYAGRASYLLSSGTPLRTAAVLFDTRSLWAENAECSAADYWRERTAERLRQKRVLFDYIDEDVLAESTVSDGKLTAGAMCYSELILPERRRVSAAAEEKIAAFAAAGGRIVSEADDAAETVRVTPDYPKLWLEARTLDEKRKIWFFFNSGDEPVEPAITLPGAEKVVLADPLTGEFFNITPAADGSFRFRFGKFDTAFFISGMTAEKALPPPEDFPSARQISGQWYITPLIRHRVGREKVEIRPCGGKPEPVAPGDWRETLGEDFSGDARYTIEFNWEGPVPEKAVLDLGKVNYCCHPLLNGRDFGPRFRGPFTFDVSGVLESGLNRLEVTVTNTLANAYAPREVEMRMQRDWPPRSGYEARQRAFERDALDSGLHGPVVIRYR